MSQRYSWEDLFPSEETKSAALFLVTTWNRIAQAQPIKVRYAEDEPKITEKLCYYLVLFSADSGLTGAWVNEAQNVLLSEEGELLDRIKKDITYFSNASEKRLELIFEFKKFSRSSLAEYRGKNGMCRFVDGNYAINRPLAVMVGILNGKDNTAIDALCNSLSKEKMRIKLMMVEDRNDRCIRRPSEAIPTIAEFDTEHLRPLEKAAQNSTTTLAHIFLTCGN